MEQPRGGWEPIALAQDQVGFEPSTYWVGSGKAVWAAIIATLFGALGIWAMASAVERHGLSGQSMLGYLLIGIPFLTFGAFPVGALLLLCRSRLGKVVTLTASAVMAVLILLVVLKERFSGRVVGSFIPLGLIVMAIAGLTASKSTKRWLARG
ncbi:hypothetical protein VMT65_04790 [Nocardia sp. CDC153]|uniref:hypothetical protein n=1 Tax=Nocardia sp. CDC153 TaxID=3112167 RepID=UPI002DB58DAC|nr:hypothetical protein [Nocardia sp. CDC153]MEC3952346.1 hypothetical protein [Nocardia sp. CDC153]